MVIITNIAPVVVMQERKVAVDSLMAIAKQLHSAHHALAEKLMGRQDLPENYALDLFYQSVKSSSDVQDFILRTAGRLQLLCAVSYSAHCCMSRASSSSLELLCTV